MTDYYRQTLGDARVKSRPAMLVSLETVREEEFVRPSHEDEVLGRLTLG